ncbi:hypothetical protein Tco_0602371 [Tanacetum coccineum]
MKLDQFTQLRFSSLTEEEGWNRIEEYIQYQDDLWDEPSHSMNISSILEAMQPTLRGRLKRACKQIAFLEMPTRENNPSEQVCLSGGDIYNDPSLLRFYQNDDTSPWGNSKRKEEGEDGPGWIVRNKFKDELANFMLEKKSHAKGIGDMLVQHHKELREQYSQILLAINKSETLEPEAPTFAITTRSGISTQDPPFLAPPRPTTDNFTEGETEKEGPEGAEPSITQEPSPPGHAIHYQPPRPSNPPLPSRLKNVRDRRRRSSLDQFGTALPRYGKSCDRHTRGKLGLRVGSETITFNIGNSMKSKHSRDDYLYYADHTAKLVQEEWVDTLNHDREWTEDEEEEDSNKALNELLEHLEYAFLQENNQLPVVISSALSTDEKNRLLKVLQNHKGAITWSITDIKGIDSSFCTHKILMEDEFKLSVQPQRQVNPNIKEVVKKEVIKLLDAGLIYPISDNPWVSPVQVVSKKGGITVVKNETDELIPQ